MVSWVLRKQLSEKEIIFVLLDVLFHPPRVKKLRLFTEIQPLIFVNVEFLSVKTGCTMPWARAASAISVKQGVAAFPASLLLFAARLRAARVQGHCAPLA